MRFRCAFVCLLLALPFVAPLSAQPGKPIMRVMTYNIRYDNPADSLDNWKYRKDYVAAMIRFHALDIVGIQEGLVNQVHDLAAALTDYQWCGKGRDDGKEAGEFSAIFYDSRKFERVADSTFWLSPTPDRPSKGWDAALNRIVTWACLKDKASGREFYVFNTHFDHLGKIAREESARLLIREIRRIAKSEPVIVTGDFNSSDSEPPYAVLTAKSSHETQLSDAGVISTLPHYGPIKTYYGFDLRQQISREHCDFIFVSDGVRVNRHGTLSDLLPNEHFPSDHLPVMAELSLP